MKGLIWDDVDSGFDVAAEAFARQKINDLKRAFGKNVTLEHDENWADIPTKLLTGEYDFAIVDLYAGEKIVGLEYFDRIREEMRENPNIRDPDFPVFLISADIEGAGVQEISKRSAPAFSKELAPAIIVSGIQRYLHRWGRWINDKEILILYDGFAAARRDAEQLKEHLNDRGWHPKLHQLGSNLRGGGLSGVVDDILKAERVVSLLTAGAALPCTIQERTHLASPDAYIGLGLVGGQVSTLRKMIILADEKVLMPDDLGGKRPIRFAQSVDDAFSGLMAALSKPRHLISD